MAQVHLHIPSFNAGELSPLLGSRVNVEKVASGCRKLRNFIPHVHGPAFRRPGMEYMGPSPGDGSRSRLIGFSFSTTTGALLVFHPNGLQVWSNGVNVPLRTEVPLPYNEAECGEIQLIQVNDVCYIAHPNHQPRKLVRFADDDWRISEVDWDWPALGDENVRGDEVASPDSTNELLVPTQEWPDWRVPAGDVTLSVTDPDLSATTKIAKLQRLDGTDWTTIATLTWTTVAPSTATVTLALKRLRLFYIGPVAATGATIDMTYTGDGGGVNSLPVDEIQPIRAREVTLTSGDWQATVSCPASIPPGSVLYLERKSGTTWGIIHTMQLLPNRTTFYRGNTLTSPRTFRFRWAGPYAMPDGEATIESLVFPTASDITISVSATDGDDRTLTASDPIFQAGHVGSYWQIAHRREAASREIIAAVPTIVAEGTQGLRVSGRWDVFTYGTWTGTLYLEKNVAGEWKTVRSWKSNSDRNVVADGTEDDEVVLRLRISAGTSAAASGADVPRFVLEAIDPAVYGLVKITAVGTLNADGKATEATCDVIAPVADTTATSLWTEGAWSDVKGHPRALALHEGRLWFAGTQAEPTRIWGSVVNDYENFRRSSLDDAGVSFTPAATQANGVNWMLSHESELLIGTGGDEWTLGTDSGPITPTNVLVKRRSAYGSEFTPAILVNEAVIFVQRGGRKVRQIVPRSDTSAWSAADMTVLADHIGKPGLSLLAAMSNPFSILWAVTADGNLAGMTFEQEQNVFGWHVHTTDGTVEGVAVVRGTECDEVWLAINRAGKRSIERFDPQVFLRAFESPERLIYADAAVRTEGAEIAEVSGLDHLEGKTVCVLADGGELDPRPVVGGAITLETAASSVIVGLPFTSELQPMRMEIPLRDGTSIGRTFRASRVALTLHDSLGGEVADGADGKFDPLNYRNISDEISVAPPLRTGIVEAVLQSKTRDGFDVMVRTSSPLPLNVGAIIIKGDVSGE